MVSHGDQSPKYLHSFLAQTATYSPAYSPNPTMWIADSTKGPLSGVCNGHKQQGPSTLYEMRWRRRSEGTTRSPCPFVGLVALCEWQVPFGDCHSPEPSDEVLPVVVVLEDGARRSANAINELMEPPFRFNGGAHVRHGQLKQFRRLFILAPKVVP